MLIIYYKFNQEQNLLLITSIITPGDLLRYRHWSLTPLEELL